jgi:hypothetical protein
MRRPYCENCAAPAIFEYLTGLRVAQALDKSSLSKNPATDSTEAMRLKKILETRAKLIELKMIDLKESQSSCNRCYLD